MFQPQFCLFETSFKKKMTKHKNEKKKSDFFDGADGRTKNCDAVHSICEAVELRFSI
jgi:hypothetical protein